MIYCVEDDASIRELVVYTLQASGFEAQGFADGAAFDTALVQRLPELVLLDIMLPDGSGLDLLRELVEKGRQMNVIILSAKDSIEDKVEGLDLGADDYLAKPFHIAELHARLKSVLRRKMRDGKNLLTLGNVVVDLDEFGVKVGEKDLDLGRKEFDILVYFMNRPSRLIDKQMLAEAVWGDYIDSADSFDFIYAQIKNLRRRLKAAGATIEIKTVYGFGYKVIVEE